MRDPHRLLDTSDSATRAMLDAASTDGPSERAHRAAAVALGLGSLAVTGTAAATATTSGMAGAAAALAESLAAGTGATVGGAATTGVLAKWALIVAIAGASTVAVGYAVTPADRGDVAHLRPAAEVPSSPRSEGLTDTRTLPRSDRRVATPAAAPSSNPPEVAAAATTVAQAAAAALPRPARPVGTLANVTVAAAPAPLGPPPTGRSDTLPEPAVATTPAAPAARSASMLTAETVTLDAARSALRANDATRALAALDDYTRAFPVGILAPEAGVLRIEALLASGQRLGAERAADRFLSEHPHSPLAERVRNLVGSRSNP